ncbi:methylenetetrahydrofolate reductase [Arthrobacter livingstonensis]|uniref:Methylenetetrahydrofolate reductase n=1 Tax=Arthrobacter livingstonensis TaxID=670078 RepID=A0A2V5LFF1_9MICC|nr:methylenetetrahydrofolate reductase [Arthrobacter livingstonensis]PYI69474.1 methylenetetrahydrofolate reductase [Arthrobacter livingstonensis]
MLPTRLEIIPTRDIVPSVLASVSVGTTITVTCLPHHGVERTLETAAALAGHGFNVVPHLAARSVASREQLARILLACSTSGITEVFAIGGDSAMPAGPFASSESLMREIADLAGNDMRIGVAGYPEGHPSISDSQLMDSLLAKQELASYVVTQMCFSAETISRYMAGLRSEGVLLPIWAGVAGAVPRTKLVLLATKIGVGSSLRFISGKGALGRNLLGGGRYRPEQLTAELEASPAPPSGIHLYSFNNVGPHQP